MGTPFSKISIIGIMVIPSFINGQNEISHSGIYYDEKGNLKTKRITASKYLPGEEPHDYHLAMQFVPNIYQYYHQRQVLSESRDSAHQTSQSVTSPQNDGSDNTVTSSKLVVSEVKPQQKRIGNAPFAFTTKTVYDSLPITLPNWHQYDSGQEDQYFKDLETAVARAATVKTKVVVDLSKHTFLMTVSADGAVTKIDGTVSFSDRAAVPSGDAVVATLTIGKDIDVVSDSGENQKSFGIPYSIRISANKKVNIVGDKNELFQLCEKLHFK